MSSKSPSFTISNLNAEKLKTNPKIHYIPAKISENCTSNVENYFDSYTQSENDHLTNAFRGYPLKGAEFKVPDGYNGVVCQEKKKPLSDATDRDFKAVYLFENFTNWNYDKVPSRFDPLHKAMDWLDISETLGEPITYEENEFQLWLENNRIKTEAE